VTRLGRSRTLRRAAAAIALGGMLVAALALLAPLQLYRASDLVFKVEELRSNPAFPRFDPESDVALFVGATSHFSLHPFANPVPSALLVVLVLVVAAAGTVGLVMLARSGHLNGNPLVALGVTIGIVSFAIYGRYKYGDEYGYGAYKALLYGGALFAGLLVGVLVGSSERRARPVQLMTVGCCFGIWLPVTVGLLDQQKDGEQGFRAPDRELGQALERLPRSSVVLVEGAAETPEAFRLRMTSAYFGVSALERKFEGLGTTASYVGGLGGAPVWLPDRPWSYVVTSNDPSPFGADRRTVWENDVFKLAAAPALDVTPFLTTSPSVAAGGRYERPLYTRENGSAQLFPAAVQLVVSNTSNRARRARLRLGVSSYDVDRAVLVSAPGSPTTSARVEAGQRRRLTVNLRVPASSTAVARVDGRPAQRRSALVGQRPLLLGLHDVRVEDFGTSPG
jgi:hypothetical protein